MDPTFIYIPIGFESHIYLFFLMALLDMLLLMDMLQEVTISSFNP